MIILAILWGGCTTRKTNLKNIFRLNFSGGTLESLDPAFAKDLYIIWATHMIYNTLVETDDQLHIVPSLAHSWDISADKTLYTFHLRTDVYFQDNAAFPDGKGRKMTASDVQYSFERLTDPGTAATGAWIFHDHVCDTAPFRVVNDSTFQIRLSRPFPPILGMLSMAYCDIVPKEIVVRWGKDFRKHPCGTGPFLLGNWDEGNCINLLKNPHYWEHDSLGTRLPYLDGVTGSFTDSKAVEFLLFRQGKLDFINGLDGSFKDIVLTKSGDLKPEFSQKFDLQKHTYLNTEYIGFLVDTTNPIMTDAPTRNVLVRKAINYSIDRKKIARYFKNGTVFPATSGFIPAGMPGYDSTGKIGYTYDPEKAKLLLAAAGYPEGKGLHELKILVQDNYVDIVNFIVTELHDVGIPASIEVMQPNILKQQMSQSQAVCFRAQWIADYPDAETYLVVFNSKNPAPPNYTRFSNPDFDSGYYSCMLLEDSARWVQYRSLDSLVMSYSPVIPLFYEQLMHFTQKTVSGFRCNAMNVIDLKYVKVR